MAKLISFYSYKGGVGRSLCLANAAALLARRGRKVVCLDCDLEAGGLHTIFGIRSSEIRYTMLDALSADGPAYTSRSLLRLTTLLPNVKSGGELWLLPTISEIPRVNEILLDSDALPSLLGNLIDQIEERVRPDFVLIDSRSGFAELAGMTIRAARNLVCVLRPNRQNIDGLAILLALLSASVPPPSTFLVLSQIPTVENTTVPAEMIERRIAQLEDLLGPNWRFGAKIPFDGLLALEEHVATMEDPDGVLAAAYEPVVNWIERNTV